MMITLRVNGERVSRHVEPRRHLIDFLRQELGLTGSHAGCEHGVCGACTVRVDGEIVRGCLVLAASLDGRTALANGESRWITGEAARADVQQLRARASAILTGIGTVLADDPRLDVRLRGRRRQPLRVVLDSHARLPAGARILELLSELHQREQTTLVLVTHDPSIARHAGVPGV
jgi:hypothetical protein